MQAVVRHVTLSVVNRRRRDSAQYASSETPAAMRRAAPVRQAATSSRRTVGKAAISRSSMASGISAAHQTTAYGQSFRPLCSMAAAGLPPGVIKPRAARLVHCYKRERPLEPLPVEAEDFLTTQLLIQNGGIGRCG